MIARSFLVAAACGACLGADAAPAAGHAFHYRFSPGETFTARQVSEVRTELMDQKSVSRTEQTIQYQVAAGPRAGWVTITARVISMATRSGDEPTRKQNVYQGMVFKANVHRTGELRDYSFSGGDPQLAAFVGPLMKAAVFMFPELPERLAPGDDFDVTTKLETGGGEAMPGMASFSGATRMTYTLDEVRKGLAYFTVQQRATVKAAGMEVKDAGKGSAVFDLKDGMWLELETRSVSRTEGGMGAGATVAQVSKSTFERR